MILDIFIKFAFVIIIPKIKCFNKLLSCNLFVVLPKFNSVHMFYCRWRYLLIQICKHKEHHMFWRVLKWKLSCCMILFLNLESSIKSGVILLSSYCTNCIQAWQCCYLPSLHILYKLDYILKAAEEHLIKKENRFNLFLCNPLLDTKTSFSRATAKRFCR